MDQHGDEAGRGGRQRHLGCCQRRSAQASWRHAVRGQSEQRAADPHPQRDHQGGNARQQQPAPGGCLLHGFIEIVSQRAEAFQVARKLALEFVPELSGQEGVAALAQAGLELRAQLRRYLLGGLSRVHGQQLGELDLCVQPAPAGFQAQALGGDVGRFLAAFRGAPSSFSLAATLASCGARVSAAASALAWMSTAVP